MTSNTEENYIKAIFSLSAKSENSVVSTNKIAGLLDTSAASVTDMIKRLSDKDLINYEKYKGVTLTKTGNKIAVRLVRKHRLWECFLVDKLKFDWHQVHEIAEQLEHIDSLDLTNRLEEFLDFPKYDPHGDPIPDRDGNLERKKRINLISLEEGRSGVVVGVYDSEKSFLQFLTENEIKLGSKLQVMRKHDFDNSILVSIDNGKEALLSEIAGKSIYVKKEDE